MKNASPFMDRMAVGFFHLLAPGLFSVRANSETTYWRINICFVALLSSFLLCASVCAVVGQGALNQSIRYVRDNIHPIVIGSFCVKFTKFQKLPLLKFQILLIFL